MILEPHNFLSVISEIEIKTKEKIFPDDLKPVSEQWAELKNVKYNPDFIDYLK